MAVKKTTSTKKQSKKISDFSLSNISDLYSSRSYTSLLYGVVTVVLLVVILFVGAFFLSRRDKGMITDTGVTTSDVAQAGALYTVHEGDTLWSISETAYNTGFEWGRIAEANKITNPSELTEGMKINIPKLAAATPTVTLDEPIPTASPDKITEKDYTVIEGDNLWDISVRAYGDGFKWVEIAQTNNIQTPDLIYPGTRYQLPR